MGKRAPSRRLKTNRAIRALVEQAAALGDRDAQAYLAAHPAPAALQPLDLFVTSKVPQT